MNTTAVDRLYLEATEMLRILGSASQPSLASAAQDQLRKGLLLASASHFENVLSACVNDFAAELSNSSLVAHLVRNKAVSRQYHSWFSWDQNNANSFFALFGPDFKIKMVAKVRADPNFQNAIRSFLELGNLRNLLIHQDFATFALDKTLEEVYQLYQDSIPFVDSVASDLRA